MISVTHRPFRKAQLKPPIIILLGFLALILVGTFLLMLPFSTRNGQSCGILTALFTATSSTCVTGLVMEDTASFWSPFGQAVILALIQMGGLGVITISVLFALLTGRRISLRQRFVMQESISAPQMGGIVRLTRFLFFLVVSVELLGTLLLSFRFCALYGMKQGLWLSLFHSVSAYCNAGFDLLGTAEHPLVSLTGHCFDPLLNAVIMILIIVGGLGFFTYDDMRMHGLRLHRYHLQSKLILTTTLILILIPTAFFFFLEFGRPVWGDLTVGQRFLLSLFQAVTPRTAGFNTADLSLMEAPSLFLTCLLMLVGGSPSSTAGGMKTTTLAVLFLCARAAVGNSHDLECFQRRVPLTALQGAVAVMLLYVTLPLVCAFAIFYLEGVPLMSAFFETCSALGTVGLSLGLTPQLHTPSLCILILLMYLGRAGGLTLLYAIADHHQIQPSHYPQENVTVG
ncbi:MAG: Trk family potassium uptake protein [Firmicutes bacterium]|nr:Trk family potassium uptake protein [Bacillota bacterium]